MTKLGVYLVEDRDGLQEPGFTGVQWITSTTFVANSSILAMRCGLKANSVCYNFRSHLFTTQPAPKDQVAHLPSGTWKLHSHPQLTRETIETDFPIIRWQRPLPIRRNPRANRVRELEAAVTAPPAFDDNEFVNENEFLDEYDWAERPGY
jgi:hypothetical protein